MKSKIFFIHVGKTAGSSFNRFLAQHFKGESHCEKYLNSDRTSIANSDLVYLQKLDYISGHLKLSVFKANNFSPEDYFLMTFLRDPTHQLISHINWMIYVYEKGLEFFPNFSQQMQQISSELGSTNLYDADKFISLMLKYQGLFKNNQSRYFSDSPENLQSKAIIENMLTLDLIGITEYYEDSLKKFILSNCLQIKPKVHTVNKNPSSKIKKDILENSKIREFIQQYQSVDLEVYQYFLSRHHNKVCS